jgi:mannose-1-phosphate guanylyltransferase
LVLLGVQPEGPETDYGWVVPRSGKNGSLRPVGSFREKPDAATAASLLKQGGLLNSFILVAGGRFLLDLFEMGLPRLWQSFQPLISGDRAGGWIDQDVVHLYRSVPTVDFSKDLLERSANQLWVYPVPACGWLDLGTPERLANHLNENRQRSCGGTIPRSTHVSDARL